MRKNILDSNTKTVVNIIEIDDLLNYNLDIGFEYGPDDDTANIGDVLVNGVYTNNNPKPPEITLDDYKKIKAMEAWRNMNLNIEQDYIAITTSAGKYNYGTDETTRNNIQMALIGVIAGLVIGSRPWTPKGETMPITLTTDEIKLIAETIRNAYDSYVQAYLTHKYNINQLTTQQDVMAYDSNVNWPNLPK